MAFASTSSMTSEQGGFTSIKEDSVVMTTCQYTPTLAVELMSTPVKHDNVYICAQPANTKETRPAMKQKGFVLMNSPAYTPEIHKAIVDFFHRVKVSYPGQSMSISLAEIITKGFRGYPIPEIKLDPHLFTEDKTNKYAQFDWRLREAERMFPPTEEEKKTHLGAIRASNIIDACLKAQEANPAISYNEWDRMLETHGLPIGFSTEYSSLINRFMTPSQVQYLMGLEVGGKKPGSFHESCTIWFGKLLRCFKLSACTGFVNVFLAVRGRENEFDPKVVAALLNEFSFEDIVRVPSHIIIDGQIDHIWAAAFALAINPQCKIITQLPTRRFNEFVVTEQHNGKTLTAPKGSISVKNAAIGMGPVICHESESVDLKEAFPFTDYVFEDPDAYHYTELAKLEHLQLKREVFVKV